MGSLRQNATRLIGDDIATFGVAAIIDAARESDKGRPRPQTGLDRCERLCESSAVTGAPAAAFTGIGPLNVDPSLRNRPWQLDCVNFGNDLLHGALPARWLVSRSSAVPRGDALPAIWLAESTTTRLVAR